MKKQPRLFPVIVAASLFLASGPLPAAAQVARVRSGIPSPYGSVTLPSMLGAGLNASLSAPSVALSPIASLLPAAAAPAPYEVGQALIVRTPGPAVTRVAEEAAAYADETAPAAVAAKVLAPVPAGRGLLGRLIDFALGRGTPAVSFDGESREKPAPTFGRMRFLPLPPVVLSNGTGTDEQPTIPSPDREPTVVLEAYGLPGARDVGGIFETSRKVLSADPADIGAVVNAVRTMIDADSARYGVPSSDLRLIHAQAFEGKGEQADSIFVYFRQTKDGLIVTGSALSFTIKVLDGRPTIVAQTGRVFPQLDVDTGTVLTDEQIMERIAERTGLPVTDAANAFQFFEEKVIYARGSWRHVKLYVAENLPFMVAVDVVAGLVFAWDNRAGLESASASGVAGEVLGKTVDKGPVLANSAISEVPLPFIEVTIGGKSYVTDKDGKLPADAAGEVGPAGLELTATLSGPFVRIENQEGETLTVKVSVKPGDNRVVFNPGARLEDENALAQINAFHKVNLSLAFLRDRKLANERMLKTQLPVRTNIGSECNAYYTPGRPSLNFFRSSKNCVNTAYDTVAEHENGHFWDDFTGGIVNGGLSEGWGDILSMFRLNNPIIGEHFLKQARDGVDYIRHGENKYQYNDLDEEHDQGQAWGGFAWKLRKALTAKLGDAAGAAMAEALVLPTIFAKASTIPEAMAQVLVNATGRDGAILHEAEIRAAARAHNVNLPSAGGGAVAAGLAERLAVAVLRAVKAPPSQRQLRKIKDLLIGFLLHPQAPHRGFTVTGIGIGRGAVTVRVEKKEEIAVVKALVERQYPDITGLVEYEATGKIVAQPKAGGGAVAAGLAEPNFDSEKMRAVRQKILDNSMGKLAEDSDAPMYGFRVEFRAEVNAYDLYEANRRGAKEQVWLMQDLRTAHSYTVKAHNGTMKSGLAATAGFLEDHGYYIKRVGLQPDVLRFVQSPPGSLLWLLRGKEKASSKFDQAEDFEIAIGIGKIYNGRAGHHHYATKELARWAEGQGLSLVSWGTEPFGEPPEDYTNIYHLRGKTEEDVVRAAAAFALRSDGFLEIRLHPEIIRRLEQPPKSPTEGSGKAEALIESASRVPPPLPIDTFEADFARESREWAAEHDRMGLGVSLWVGAWNALAVVMVPLGVVVGGWLDRHFPGGPHPPRRRRGWRFGPS